MVCALRDQRSLSWNDPLGALHRVSLRPIPPSIKVGNMAEKSKLPMLVLTAEERQRLERLSTSRSASLREVERARILLHHQAGNNPSSIQSALKISRVTIYPLCRLAPTASVTRPPAGPFGSDTFYCSSWGCSPIRCSLPTEHPSVYYRILRHPLFFCYLFVSSPSYSQLQPAISVVRCPAAG